MVRARKVIARSGFREYIFYKPQIVHHETRNLLLPNVSV